MSTIRAIYGQLSNAYRLANLTLTATLAIIGSVIWLMFLATLIWHLFAVSC